VNWKEALGEAQAQVEKVMKPKLDALHSAVSELEESLGIEIDASSLSKLQFLVRRFPRKPSSQALVGGPPQGYL